MFDGICRVLGETRSTSRPASLPETAIQTAQRGRRLADCRTSTGSICLSGRMDQHECGRMTRNATRIASAEFCERHQFCCWRSATTRLRRRSYECVFISLSYPIPQPSVLTRIIVADGNCDVAVRACRFLAMEIGSCSA